MTTALSKSVEPTFVQVLTTSIAEIGTAVAGEDGDKIRALAGQSGFVANTVRKVIGLFLDLLQLIATGLGAVENLVRGTDALLALTQVLLDSADALGEALSGAVSLTARDSAGPNDNQVTGTVLTGFGGVLGQSKELLPMDVIEEALPSVHEIIKARTQLAQLLQAPGPDEESRRSLVALAQKIEPQQSVSQQDTRKLVDDGQTDVVKVGKYDSNKY